MDFDTFDTDIFAEINDAPGEIFDIPEMQDSEKFDVEKFINGDIDFWLIMYTDPCTFAMNSFNFYLKSLPSFITQSNPTWREVYDWMEDMCGPLKDYHWEEVEEVYKEFKNVN